MREMTSGMVTEIESDALSPIMLGWFDFASQPLYAWTGIGDLSWNGETWVGVGHILGIDAITETDTLRAEGVSFQLTAVPSVQVAAALTEQYQGRAAQLWVGALDGAGQIVSDPVLTYIGKMDNMEIDDGADSAVISLSVENQLIDMRRAREWRYTDDDQKFEFPNDRGFEYVAGLQDKAILWGR